MSAPTFAMLPVAQLVPSPLNVRKRFNAAADADLVESVKTHGILTPLLVRRLASTNGLHEVAAGHRRLQAAKAAGVTEVPCTLREMDDRTFRELMLTENIQRVDPDPLDEADSFQAMIDDLGYDVATLATKFGKSEFYVRSRLVLTNLSDKAREALEAGFIELGHAVLLARASEARQDELLDQRLLKDKFGTLLQHVPAPDADEEYEPGETRPVASDPVRTTVSIAQLREYMAERMLPLAPVKWDQADPTLVVTAGACTTCPKRSGAAPSLFPELDATDDRCTDPACYAQKTEAYLMARVAAVRSQAPNVVLVSRKLFKPMKKFQRERVLHVGTDAKESNKKGAVPALVVEASWDVDGGWDGGLGELLDVQLVDKQAPAAPAARKAEKAAGKGDDDGARRVATQRFDAAITAVLRAILTSEKLLADRCQELVLEVLGAGLQDLDYDLTNILKEMDVPPAPVQLARLVAALMLEGVEIPSQWTTLKVLPITRTYELPNALVAIAQQAGVDAHEVWNAALVALDSPPAEAPAPTSKAKKGKR